ncbi:diacylglycerol kinase family lipid kinase [Deinococcus taeanensis]|uniref:diacylglycerol/lipid kinase family protein n=1 Tax=Deinococcus taeanensis TaxID=2737050 RepID=UPI001CDC4C3E|nr:diacylglycerol kinase family protein [Deinococcus taeanensis]UBV43890.1 diacylglycerol kinase family lipid kinase [Deinococcus taeanensis]
MSTDAQSRPAGRPSLTVVLNPQAGGGQALRSWPRLRDELDRRGLRYTLIQESSAAAAASRVQSLAPGVAVMAVGGDGTIGALLPALVNSDRQLAIMPLGTGNDFAGLLGLKPGAFGEALDRLAFTPRSVDALRVRCRAPDGQQTERWLLNGLGMGFDADVTANMPRVPRAVRGFARYAWAAVITLRELKLSNVTVQADGQVVYAGPSAIVAVMNGTRYGGGFRISPASDVRDGRVNVVVGGPMNRLQLADLMGRVLRGAHLGHPLVHTAAAQEVTVTWHRPVRVHLDGDLSGAVTGMDVQTVPGAVRLLNAWRPEEGHPGASSASRVAFF